MTGITRRDLMAASGMALAGATELRAAIATAPPLDNPIAADLDRYVGFGIKASGGTGDIATGDWIEHELRAAGYTVARQVFDVPFFRAAAAQLHVDATTIELLPQALVVPTPDVGLSGPLVRIDPVSVAAAPLAGAIALLDLPAQRWSTALAKPIADTIAQAWSRGALAAVIVTNGPTGEAIALNTPSVSKIDKKPVAIMAPRLARPALLAAANGKQATFHIGGQGGTRPAFNLIGRIDRGKGRWLIASTPRSGWFACAGERGPGVTAWLALARWAAVALPEHDLAFVCNSGHEYEYLGAEKMLAAALPPRPADTALWLHLGANVAARDWQELPGGILLPLPSADPQRFLVTSPALLPTARAAFAGQPGLEIPYPTGTGTAGELTGILAAGYGRVAGIFGAHRFHHVATDDARCVAAPLVAPVVEACKALLKSA